MAVVKCNDGGTLDRPWILTSLWDVSFSLITFTGQARTQIVSVLMLLRSQTRWASLPNDLLNARTLFSCIRRQNCFFPPVFWLQAPAHQFWWYTSVCSLMESSLKESQLCYLWKCCHRYILRLKTNFITKGCHLIWRLSFKAYCTLSVASSPGSSQFFNATRAWGRGYSFFSSHKMYSTESFGKL